MMIPRRVHSRTHLLLDLEDGELELGLDLRVLDLEALQAVNTPADGRGKRLDVARGTADERAELALGKSEERGVL
jgi:hypothetical protein